MNTINIKKTQPSLEDIIKAANVSPVIEFDAFHMNTANIERLKNMNRIVISLTDPPENMISDIAGIKFTVNDMLPDNRVVVCLGQKVVGVIKLGEEENVLV